MASLNLSKVLLDPQIGEAFTTKLQVKEEHLYSSGLWSGAGGKIRTLDDLELEMADEIAEDRDDLSDDGGKEDEDAAEIEERYKAMAAKIKTSEDTTENNESPQTMSVAEMQEIIES